MNELISDYLDIKNMVTLWELRIHLLDSISITEPSFEFWIDNFPLFYSSFVFLLLTYIYYIRKQLWTYIFRFESLICRMWYVLTFRCFLIIASAFWKLKSTNICIFVPCIWYVRLMINIIFVVSWSWVFISYIWKGCIGIL